MSSDMFGVREFATLCLLLLRFYLRHKDNIDDQLPAGFVEALATIALNEDLLDSLNPPGPI